MVITECSEDRFEFGVSGGGSRQVVAEFSGGTINSAGGGLLLRETDTRMNLLARFSQCFVDGRNRLQTTAVQINRTFGAAGWKQRRLRLRRANSRLRLVYLGP